MESRREGLRMLRRSPNIKQLAVFTGKEWQDLAQETNIAFGFYDLHDTSRWDAYWRKELVKSFGYQELFQHQSADKQFYEAPDASGMFENVPSVSSYQKNYPLSREEWEQMNALIYGEVSRIKGIKETPPMPRWQKILIASLITLIIILALVWYWWFGFGGNEDEEEIVKPAKAFRTKGRKLGLEALKKRY